MKPKPGTVVRDPRTKQLMPEEGVLMPEHDLALARLLQDGDLVKAAGPTPAAAPAEASAAPPSPAGAEPPPAAPAAEEKAEA